MKKVKKVLKCLFWLFEWLGQVCLFYVGSILIIVAMQRVLDATDNITTIRVWAWISMIASVYLAYLILKGIIKKK